MYYHVLQRITIECPSNVNVIAWSKERGARSVEFQVAGCWENLSPVTCHLSKIKEKR